MRQILVYIYILLVMACSIPKGEGYRLWVQLTLPETLPQFTMEGTEVKLINTGNGTVYRSFANKEGIVVFDAEYGIYRLAAQKTCYNNSFTHLLNAGRENIHLIPARGIKADTLSLSLTDSPLSNIIIKEIYYSGCYDANGKQYIKDSYISIYNNSDRTVWLDSLCIGLVGPPVANKISPWITYNPGMLPIAYLGWQFPGTGHDYPLLPGQETIIATNAVNHQGDQYNHPNSVDLSKVDWAFYHSSLTTADISTGVTPLNMFVKLSPITSYIFGLTGPGIILYEIKGNTAQGYADNPDHLLSEPPTFRGPKYLMIPADWVVDCVDCVENGTKQGFKRFPSFLDAEAAFLPSGKFSGRSLHRKITKIQNGRIIYQDTNNSANDFEERVPTRKNE